AVDVNKTIDKGSDATKAVDSSRDVAEEAAEEASKKGGKYKDVRSANKGGEVHHTPANSTNNVAHGEGPSIHMETTDHRKTASWGSSKDAQAYRKKQKELQKKGRRDDAIQMDIDDVKDKFGEKYDEAIEQMIDDLD
ncbi:MAG: phosphoglycerate kinase, partial [Akkermansiaceae bacterium]